MSWVKERSDTIKEYEEKYNIVWEYGRRSGRTTGNLLQAISKAMLSPEQPITIEDHHHGTDPKRFTYMAPMLRDLLEKLELDGFYFKRSEGAILYSTDPNYIDTIVRSSYLTEIK